MRKIQNDCLHPSPLSEPAGLIYIVAGLAAVTTSANIGSSFITAAGSGPAFGFLGLNDCIAIILLS